MKKRTYRGREQIERKRRKGAEENKIEGIKDEVLPHNDKTDLYSCYKYFSVISFVLKHNK